MPKIGTKWTLELIDDLKTRLNAGESVSQIAGGMIMTGKAEHMTRNMVSGIKWRLGLCTPKKIVLDPKGNIVKTRPRPRRPNPFGKGAAKARKRSLRSPATTQWASDPKRMTAPQLPTEGIFKAPGMKCVALEDLESGHCRWPLWANDRRQWDLGALIYCGAEAETGMPYCGCHCRIAYAPTGRLNEHRIPAQ